ncbi:glutathione S-transferase [Maribius pontilimi]|uniref:Glutathione S-transferase n=1 Tax=Palleronia pontilimi TaxID=1964209 RepID=A0A934MB64_9RHOB|nr:glutathione S-transferase [Palleronia pontilimi]MBJ3761190.1 glutathione S-transferase [Palleronia pontilimi]
MTHELILGDPAYSSWSLRAWLLVTRFDIPHRLRWVELYADTPLAAQIAAPPARTVPTLLFDGGAVASDTISIAEELATRYPDRGFWPTEPLPRAMARNLAAEMHAGFAALRNACPMCLRTAYADVPVSAEVQVDLDRLDVIWTDALARSGGPWLAGDYSIADAFYAPVAARIAGYGLAASDVARDYVDRHLGDPAFAEWRALAKDRGPDLHEVQYKMPYPRRPFPDSLPR